MVPPPSSFLHASSSGSNEHLATEAIIGESSRNEIEPQAHLSQHSSSCDVNGSNEFPVGMMKIIPSDVDVSMSFLYIIFIFRKNVKQSMVKYATTCFSRKRKKKEKSRYGQMSKNILCLSLLVLFHLTIMNYGYVIYVNDLGHSIIH